MAHPVPPWLDETPRNDVPVDETPGQPLPSDDFPAPVDGIYLAGDTRAASLITLAPEAAAEINAAHKAFTMKYKNGGFGSVNDHLGGIVVRSRNRAIRLAATLYGLERGQDLAGDAIFNCAIIPAHIARFAWREIMYQFTNAMVNGLYGVHVYGHERKREAEERLKNAPTNTSLYEAFIKEVSDKFGNRPIVIRELVQAFNRRKFGGSIVDTKYARSALEWAVAARLFSAADETTSKGKTTRKYFAKPDLNALADQAEAEAAIDTQVRATAGSLQEAAAYPVRNGHLNPPPLATTPGAPPQLY